MSQAKHFPFSLSESDPAYKILQKVTGNRSEWIRQAIVFYDKYRRQEHDIERALALYHAGGSEAIIQRIEGVISRKLDQVAGQLASQGITATEEINRAKVDAMDDLLSKFDEGI